MASSACVSWLSISYDYGLTSDFLAAKHFIDGKIFFKDFWKCWILKDIPKICTTSISHRIEACLPYDLAVFIKSRKLTFEGTLIP